MRDRAPADRTIRRVPTESHEGAMLRWKNAKAPSQQVARTVVQLKFLEKYCATLVLVNPTV